MWTSSQMLFPAKGKITTQYFSIIENDGCYLFNRPFNNSSSFSRLLMLMWVHSQFLFFKFHFIPSEQLMHEGICIHMITNMTGIKLLSTYQAAIKCFDFLYIEPDFFLQIFSPHNFLFYKKRLNTLGRVISRGVGRDDNITINFMQPDPSKLCVEFYLLTVSINTTHDTDRNIAFFK